ncbi:hypothetical protein Thiowin_04195 [Thiorhodovibrio winogradskyi]|uniref:Uncharacterized protein n=1 Tax=Thiorhodovibrio winogradskyi TaxID=77007 RepID=A0ABZ0SGA5_9GAMM
MERENRLVTYFRPMVGCVRGEVTIANGQVMSILPDSWPVVH